MKCTEVLMAGMEKTQKGRMQFRIIEYIHTSVGSVCVCVPLSIIKSVVRQ